MDIPKSFLLCISNKELYYKYLKDLFYSSTNPDYLKFFNEQSNELKFDDIADFIPSLIDLNINNKKNINRLLRLIKNGQSDILKDAGININNILLDSFNLLQLNSPLNIYSDIDISDDDILKMMNISLMEEDDKTLLESVFEYMKVSFELRNTKTFIFYGLSAFLTSEELSSLILNAKYEGISIILFECDVIIPSIFDIVKKLDEDYCLLD